MSKHSLQHLPKEDELPSNSGAGTGQSRYKPLAPKESLSGHGSHQSQKSRSATGEAAQQLQSLTFVNTTDPRQSKSQESRKFVRTQVMKNFARERRRQRSLGDNEPDVGDPSSGSNVQGVLSAALPLTVQPLRDYSTLQRALAPDSSTQPLRSDKAIDRTGNDYNQTRPDAQRSESASHHPTVHPIPIASNRTDSIVDVERANWLIPADLQVQELLNHCHSPAFRACHPQYMISLIANRPSAEHYPFFADIESNHRFELTHGTEAIEHNELYQLAQRSPPLAHALLMISSSHLASTEADHTSQDGGANFHKDRALQLLNEDIKTLPTENYLETLATIAVLASHELIEGDYNEWTAHLMGIGRVLNMAGGITLLPQESLIRKLIIWSDQMGALVMNTTPFFPAIGAMSPLSRSRTTIAPLLPESYVHQEFLGQPLRDFVSAFGFSSEFINILDEIATICTVGPENILESSASVCPAPLIELRDVLLHHVLSMAPAGIEKEIDDESSDEECIRLAVLVLILDRLFSPVLPPAYHLITGLVTDRLNAALVGKASSMEWKAHAWVFMWIVFVGATVHNGDISTRKSLINSAVPLCGQLFTSGRETSHQLHAGLSAIMSIPQLYEEDLINAFATELEQECNG